MPATNHDTTIPERELAGQNGPDASKPNIGASQTEEGSR
jgi:hypothetical protein